MEFKQQAGGEATGDAPCHEQIADPGEQRRRIGGGCQALFEGLQHLHLAAAPEGIDQGVFCRDVLQLSCRGHGIPRSSLCHGSASQPLKVFFRSKDDLTCFWKVICNLLINSDGGELG